jgi:uncharacterized protein (TIGR02118 family)
MVRLLCFLKRKPGMSAEDFYRHWKETHGPLIAGRPNLARHIVRYEQHRRLTGDDPLSGTEGFDGVAVQWFESMDEFRAFIAEPDYAEHVFPDEAKFLDRDGLVFLVTEEPTVVIDGPVSASG